MEILKDDTLPVPDKQGNGCFIIGSIKHGHRRLMYYSQGEPIDVCSTTTSPVKKDSLWAEIDELCKMVNSSHI